MRRLLATLMAGSLLAAAACGNSGSTGNQGNN